MHNFQPVLSRSEIELLTLFRKYPNHQVSTSFRHSYVLGEDVLKTRAREQQAVDDRAHLEKLGIIFTLCHQTSEYNQEPQTLTLLTEFGKDIWNELVRFGAL